MKNGLRMFVLILFLHGHLLAQKNDSTEPDGVSAEEILLKQAQTRHDQEGSPQNLNERMRSLARLTKTVNDYLLGPGDIIEITVVGIPGLDKKQFALDGQGGISVPYLGQVDLLGVTTRDAEFKLARLFAASLLEDPQVTISIREYRSQYYYIMGAVNRPGKYALSQSTDLLDALSLAGGLTDKADSKIKIYRYSQQPAEEQKFADMGVREDNVKSANEAIPSNALEISLPDLLESGQNGNRMVIVSGDVVVVQERKERTYYVLGDIPRPGAFTMRPNERMAFSQALANAGGMLRTASGKKVTIIRKKEGEALPEQIRVNAYAVLKGDVKDPELWENDIVLVPGSASKTLGKSFMSGFVGILTTVLIIGVH